MDPPTHPLGRSHAAGKRRSNGILATEAHPRPLFCPRFPAGGSSDRRFLLGAGLGVADRSHFALDLLTPRLHGKSCQAVRLGTAIVVLVIAVVMAISGWSLAVTGMGRRSLITGLPVVWVYGSVLIAGILMIVFALGWVMKTFTKPNSPEE